MQRLDPVEAVSTVLSFDFDGTLHDPAAVPSVPTEFFELISELRESQGAAWGINTGRSMPHVVEGLVESKAPFLPDWVVAREREIYFPNRFGRWVPELKWNERCEKDIHRLFKKHRKLLKKIREEVLAHTGAEWIEMEGEPAGLVARRVEDMEWIEPRVIELTAEAPELGWQRNSIWLRFGHRNYQKGSSLTEVARHYGVKAERCFATGDGHNDLAMLTPEVAGLLACPANAVEEVRTQVARHGGHVCQQGHGDGAIEALRKFFPS